MNEKMSLLELNNRIRDALQGAFPETLWVVAEISEIKVNRTGHCYLELVEKDDVTDELTARARATIWSYTFRMLRPYFETTTGQPLAEGIKILVQVSVEYHPGYGLSLNIKDIDPTYTLGDLALRRREIIRRLEEAGVFHMNQELPLPLVPQRIAVISSATAAGYQDFTDQLENNAYGFRFEVRLFEAFMQGSEAVPSILDALDRIFHEEAAFDAVAILRGGGSQADLSCFDHFDLAFAVAQFPLPVITGIGHEKDGDLGPLTGQGLGQAQAVETALGAVGWIVEDEQGLHAGLLRLDGMTFDGPAMVEPGGHAALDHLCPSEATLRQQGGGLGGAAVGAADRGVPAGLLW